MEVCLRNSRREGSLPTGMRWVLMSGHLSTNTDKYPFRRAWVRHNPPRPYGRRGPAVSLLRRRRLDLLHLLSQGRGQDRLSGQLRLHDEVVPRARQRAGPDGRRRGLLPAVPRSLHQAARDAPDLQYARPLGLPVRLRPVCRSPAAFVSVAHRDHRSLQPAVPDLLRQQRADTPAVQDARAHPAAHRRRRPQRGRARRRADLGRGADHPPAVLRGARLRQGRADPAPDGEHQRHPHRARRGLRRASRPLHAGLRGVPAVRLARRRSRRSSSAAPICAMCACARSRG